MDDQKLRIYNAIASFVQDLNTEFGKKYKPVALYNRLIEKTTLGDVVAIDRHIKAFRTFFDQNPKYFKDARIKGDSRICYSDRIFLDIGKIMSKTDAKTHEYVNKHLITIYTLMNLNNEKGKAALETLKEKEPSTNDATIDIALPDTSEGNFIKDTLTDMTAQFENLGDEANPMQMMSSMMQSGFFTKFMGDLQNKMESGEMNLQSLMGTVTSVIGDVAPQDGPQGEHMANFLNTSMGQVAALTSGGDPTVQGDMQAQMNTLLEGLNLGGAPPASSNTPTSAPASKDAKSNN